MALKLKKSFPPWLLNTGRRSLDRNMESRAERSWMMRQIREDQTWKQARIPAGAAMCETRDFGY